MKKIAVTIAREYGSGGRIIGRELARELGFAFYDKELISLAAKECGFHEDFVQTMENRTASGFLFNIYMTYNELPIPEQVFIAQSNAIREIASRESCVIIGRCADYVLAEMKRRVNFFIYAPLEWRLKIVRDEYREGEGELSGYIRKQDKDRASYYNFFTQKKWGKAQNYNLCLDSSIGLPASVKLLKKYVEEFAGFVSESVS
ncbi:MAG: cytidylate kinase-like family protein [Synergistaceae bacterium]|jgi:cytidylate kinase|nr:cytidylate kinase-like family protein [Synergistaceae bacterium]